MVLRGTMMYSKFQKFRGRMIEVKNCILMSAFLKFCEGNTASSTWKIEYSRSKILVLSYYVEISTVSAYEAEGKSLVTK